MDEIIHEDNSYTLHMVFMRSFQERRADDESRKERSAIALCKQNSVGGHLGWDNLQEQNPMTVCGTESKNMGQREMPDTQKSQENIITKNEC